MVLVQQIVPCLNVVGVFKLAHLELLTMQVARVGDGPNVALHVVNVPKEPLAHLVHLNVAQPLEVNFLDLVEMGNDELNHHPHPAGDSLQFADHGNLLVALVPIMDNIHLKSVKLAQLMIVGSDAQLNRIARIAERIDGRLEMLDGARLGICPLLGR